MRIRLSCLSARGEECVSQIESNATNLPLVAPGTADAEALVVIIRRLTHAHSIDEIMEIVTDAARHLLEADGITFVLREGDDCYYAEEDAIEPLWKGRRFPMDACISGWCMRERRPAAIADTEIDPRIPQDVYRPTFVRSLVMVPVRQEDPIAAMGAYWAMRGPASRYQIDLMQTVANAASLALTKIELEREREKVGQARRELSHRLGNVFAVVQAIANQSFKSAADPYDAEAILSGRLQALAGAQTLLLSGEDRGADIHALVQEQLMIDHAESRVSCDGPAIFLAADEAFELGLVLHELGTNSRKYGALSSPAGEVSINWTLLNDEDEKDRRLVALCWSERGGPKMEVPGKTGFGSSLLRGVFRRNGGGVTVDYAPDGLICDMRIPAPPDLIAGRSGAS